jgi:hypothetical protein
VYLLNQFNQMGLKGRKHVRSLHWCESILCQAPNGRTFPALASKLRNQTL